MIPASLIPRAIWLHTLIIIVIGLLALYSASYNNDVVGMGVFYDQLSCALLGILIMFVLSRGDYRKFFDVAYPVYGISVFFLFLVLVMGRHALGATRWFSVGGVSFQPSEFSKLAVIFFLGRYFSQRRPKLSFDVSTPLRDIWGDLIWPLVLTLISVGLIFKQPDLGTAILVMGIFMVMLYASGIPWKVFAALLGLLGLMMPLAWHVLKPYQKDRLLVFLDPSHDPLGAGYTITQSKIAVGSGELLGKGWLSGTQSQLNFLPERHTDFIFSVIGEEWGLVGSLILIYCYTVIIYCGFKIARHNKDPFGQLVTIGIVSILAMQVVINIGMVMGLLPVVGITLPLISYGRTSFMVFVILIGFLLNLSRKRAIF
ncbi:MAG: rod shape-determining protein RodA [Candidatus Omnitrophica bacterium]|nr:rod shape-determining protein RodA [Candidatus Omnitrophota bacterium]MDE2221553.1 rod shape-determining protein RodA [Candidatus Omnitrophota bacterium]